MPSFGYEYHPLPDSNLAASSSTKFIQNNTFTKTNQRPDSYDQISYGQTHISNQPNRRNSLAKLNDFRKKVHQVINLCTHQNSDVKGNLSQVIHQERQLYDLLIEDPSVLKKTLSHQALSQAGFNMQQTVPYNQSNANYQVPLGPFQRPSQQIKTPLRPLKSQNIPQSHYFIPNLSQVVTKQNNPALKIQNSSVVRPLQGYQHQDFQSAQFGQLLGGFNASQNLQSSFLKLKTDKQIHLNKDALRLIEEIERKAFEQIERLRKQKLSIMQRLNQQIRNVNEQKRKNSELQSILARLRSEPQNPDGFGVGVGVGNTAQNIQAKISRLEGELQRTNQINHNLRLELTNRGSGVPGIEELLRQGEFIRQQTLRLLRAKQQGEGGNLRIQQIERQLIAEQAEKQSALNQIRFLKEKLNGVSQKKIYPQNPSNERSIARSRPTQQGKAVGQYEDLVSQMKRITGF